MDSKVIQRIDGVLASIDEVGKEMKGVNYDAFLSDKMLMSAVSFQLIQIGERMVKLEQLLKEKYPELPWSQARKMRNIIVHDYENANPKIIYDTAMCDLEVLESCFYKIKDDIKHISENSLFTERLLLRPWDEMDAKELLELAKEPEIGFWCGWEPHKNIRDSLFALHNFLEIKETYAICLKSSGKIVGSIGLNFKENSQIVEKDNECELGYWIGKEFWGNGYATEAGKAVIKHAFNDLKISKIWCGYYDGNNRSKKVQEKLGFVFNKIIENTPVPQLNENRTTIINHLSKEAFKD